MLGYFHSSNISRSDYSINVVKKFFLMYEHCQSNKCSKFEYAKDVPSALRGSVLSQYLYGHI